MKQRSITMMTLTCVGAILANAAVAQQQQDQQGIRSRSDQGRQQQQDRGYQQPEDTSGTRGQNRQQQSRGMQQQDRDRPGSPQLRIVPEGWVSVAADYDNDGRYESVETMYVYDLMRARNMSRERQSRQEQVGREGNRPGRSRQDERYARGRGRQDRGRQQQMAARGRSERQSSDRGMRGRRDRQQMAMRGNRMDREEGRRGVQDRQRRHQQTVSGEIADLKTINLAGTDQKQQQCLVARVKTQEGRSAKVLLGPKDGLSRLNLREGDNVTVRGKRGHVNDRSMMIARQVSTGDRQVSVDMPGTPHLKRARGDIVSKRTVKFRGFDDQHVVARVKLVSGKTELVNLGPQSKVKQLDLQEGDQVSLLVRPGRIAGESAMIAEQIRANNELITLPRPQDMRRFKKRSGDEIRG